MLECSSDGGVVGLCGQIEAKYNSKAAQMYKIALAKKVKASTLQIVAPEVEEVRIVGVEFRLGGDFDWRMMLSVGDSRQ